MDDPRSFRKEVRCANFCGPTNGVCRGFVQCNLVVLRQKDAFDFLLFCVKNQKACPLIDVCDVGSPHPSSIIGKNVDLRMDVPKYMIYQNGELHKEVTDVTEYWPEDSVAFLIGCSFTCDAALQDAGISLRSIELKKNIPMYKTSIECNPAGKLSGHLVVSMKPIPATDVALEVEITSKYPKAHGGPVCVGCPSAIGIKDITKPDWGESIDILSDEVPVFHACGVTAQNVLIASKVEFAITHKPGHMLVTDLSVNDNNVFEVLPRSKLIVHDLENGKSNVPSINVTKEVEQHSPNTDDNPDKNISMKKRKLSNEDNGTSDHENKQVVNAVLAETAKLSKKQRKKLAKKKSKELEEVIARENFHMTSSNSGDKEKLEKSNQTKKTKTTSLTKQRSLPGGILIQDIIHGTGPTVKSGKKVSITYEGSFPETGKIFDKNLNKNKPLVFRINTGEVIKGLERGMEGMKVGGERIIITPPALAYGRHGSPPTIPKNATLSFAVTLLSVGGKR